MKLSRIAGVTVVLAAVAGLVAFCVNYDYYSESITDTHYLTDLGITDGAEYPLLANPEPGEPTVQGTVSGSGSTFLSIGSFELHGNILTVQSVRFGVTIKGQIAVVDYPMTKIAWAQKAGVAPSVNFSLKAGEHLYFMGDRHESIWKPNPPNSEKTAALDEFTKAPAELIATYALKATVTVTPEVFMNEVLPLQRGKVK